MVPYPIVLLIRMVGWLFYILVARRCILVVLGYSSDFTITDLLSGAPVLLFSWWYLSKWEG